MARVAGRTSSANFGRPEEAYDARNEAEFRHNVMQTIEELARRFDGYASGTMTLDLINDDGSVQITISARDDDTHAAYWTLDTSDYVEPTTGSTEVLAASFPYVADTGTNLTDGQFAFVWVKFWNNTQGFGQEIKTKIQYNVTSVPAAESGPSIVIDDEWEEGPNTGGLTGTEDADVAKTGDLVWDDIHDPAVGTAVDAFGPYVRMAGFDMSSTTDKYTRLSRWFITFDVSTYDANPSAAVLSVRVQGITKTNTGHSVRLVGGTPVDPEVVATTDYNQTGTIPFSSDIALADISVADDLEFTLNAAGVAALVAAVDGTGFFTVAMVLEADRNDIEPTWGSTESAFVKFYSSTWTTEAQRPDLQIWDTPRARVSLWHDDPDGQTIQIEKRTVVTPAHAGAFATATLTFTGTPVATDAFTIGGVTYTFIASPAAANDIDVGVDKATSIANLVAAINYEGTPGTDYHEDTVFNPYVSATDNGDSTITVTARVAGREGNKIAVSSTEGDMTWSSATLESTLTSDWLVHLDNDPDPVPEGNHGTGINALANDSISVLLHPGAISWIQARLKYTDVNGAILYTSPITSSGFDIGDEPNIITFNIVFDHEWNASIHAEVDYDTRGGSIRIAGEAGSSPSTPTVNQIVARRAANIADSNVGRTFDAAETAMFYSDFPIPVAAGETVIFAGQAYSEEDGLGNESLVYTAEARRPADPVDETPGGDPYLKDVTYAVTDNSGEDRHTITWSATDANLVDGTHNIYIEVFKYAEGEDAQGTAEEDLPDGTTSEVIDVAGSTFGGQYRAEVYLRLDTDDSVIDHETLYDATTTDILPPP